MGYTNRSPVQRTYSGRFTGIDAADPTSYKLDPGVSVTRTAEGVFKVQLPPPVAGFKAVYVAVNDTAKAHAVEWALSVPNRTVTITHKEVAWASVASGPSAQDVVPEINFIIVVEESDCMGAGI